MNQALLKIGHGQSCVGLIRVIASRPPTQSREGFPRQGCQTQPLQRLQTAAEGITTTPHIQRAHRDKLNRSR